VNSVRFAGSSDAEPAPGVLEAISLCRRGHHRSEQSHHQHRPDSFSAGNSRCPAQRARQSCAVSPIIGNAAVAGPAGILMTAQGLPCSIAGVAKAYEDFLDLLVCDTRDARAAGIAWPKTVCKCIARNHHADRRRPRRARSHGSFAHDQADCSPNNRRRPRPRLKNPVARTAVEQP